MARSELALRRRARRAYELRRLLRQLPVALFAIPVMVLGPIGLPAPVSPWLHGLVLGAGLVIVRWRGQDVGRGAVPGLLAGLAVMAVPLLACEHGVCPIGPSAQLALLCTAVAAIGGAALALCSLSCCRRPLLFLLSATAVASVTGVAGCALAGVAGILGMLAGLAVGSLPVLLWDRVSPAG